MQLTGRVPPPNYKKRYPKTSETEAIQDSLGYNVMKGSKEVEWGGTGVVLIN